jgi:dTDP-4-dehydrorhamnose reductase
VKVLVTGANGMLGRDVTAVLAPRHQVLPHPREALDVTDPRAVLEAVKSLGPGAVVNCAGFTDVDGAEERRDEAFRVNALGARHAAVAADAAGAVLVHVSTDYVFDGTAAEPYTEFDRPAPLSVYGRSKLSGEEAVRTHCRRHFILRTAWLYGAHGRNFVHTILRAAREKDVLEVVDDQVGSPTWTLDVARVIGEVLETGAFGTYHAAAEGQCSWYAFACAILKARGIDTPVRPVETSRVRRPARRPPYSVMRNLCLEALGVRMRRWDEALADFLARTPDFGAGG